MTYNIEYLAQVLGQKLVQCGWHISCAESCTGGGLGFAITSIPGSSAWFNRGFITYSNQAKVEMLGVSENTLLEFGAVSKQTVAEMAQGAAAKANAQVSVSISGIAGPDGGTPDKPVGTVWFGFYINGSVFCQKQCFNGDRTQIRNQAIEYALATVEEAISL